MGPGERKSGMRRSIGDRERAQRATARLRVLQHYEEVSRNISRTCRFFGISRTLFYEWRRRYQRGGLEGLRPRLPGPRVSPFRTPPHIEALVLRLRQDRQYGVPRLRLFLRRYHAVSLSMPTIRRILREHHVPRVSQKRYRQARSGGQSCISPDNRSRWTSNISRRSRAGSTNSPPSTKPPAIASSRSTTTTPSSPPFSSSMRCARHSPWRSVEFRPTTAPNGAPISPGICTISASPTGTSHPAVQNPMGRSNVVIAPTRTSSTGG